MNVPRQERSRNKNDIFLLLDWGVKIVMEEGGLSVLGEKVPFNCKLWGKKKLVRIRGGKRNHGFTGGGGGKGIIWSPSSEKRKRKGRKVSWLESLPSSALVGGDVATREKAPCSSPEKGVRNTHCHERGKSLVT